MPKKKGPFIDKKNAVTFRLVHRSQHDPLITDETAPQHVLVDINKAETVEQRDKRKETERKYGIFFDDDYDYMQHLRDRGQGDAIHWEYIPSTNSKACPDNAESARNRDCHFDAKLRLPSSLFASEYEESEGMLSKAAPHSGPRPDLDPDIVAAMDENFDFDNQDNILDDDFMEMAMGGNGDDQHFECEHSDIDSQFDVDEENEAGDTLGSLANRKRFSNFDKEETRSRFTEYSMSSSVMRRNEQLELLDNCFEKFYENYDEPEIGALDCEEIEGHIEMNNDLMEQCMTELKRKNENLEYDRKWDEQRIKQILEDSSDEETVELEVESNTTENKWDCESVLSTYTTVNHHPKLIDEPRSRSKIVIDPKTGVPTNVFNGNNNQLTLKSVAKLNTTSDSTGPKSVCAQSVLSTLSVLSIRPKEETTEEKRQRKKLFRDYRAERRIERKNNTRAFKEEKIRQAKIDINNANNIQGNRMI